MNDVPRISVVVPTFNYGRFLPEALASVFRQTLAPCEVIVVDDGSTDNTPEVIAAYGERVVFLQQKNQGPSAARNEGIRRATGEWVAFLDADDVWFPTRLEMQSKCLHENPCVGLIGTLSMRPAADGGSLLALSTPPASESAEPYTVLGTRDFIQGLPFGTSTALARKDLLLKAGLFNPARRLAEDREMWLKLSLLAPAARVNQVLSAYRLHGSQSINSARRMAENYAVVLANFFAAHPEYAPLRRRAQAYYHYDTAMAYFESGAKWPALRHLLRSFLNSPIPLSRGNAEHGFNRLAFQVRLLLGPVIFSAVKAVYRRLRPKAIERPSRRLTDQVSRA
ncbi:MAG TPA: glycosyltransferase [Planctomycetota bacterium]|jgi:glycosyltransferase involved in cell wall biosynthesis